MVVGTITNAIITCDFSSTSSAGWLFFINVTLIVFFFARGVVHKLVVLVMLVKQVVLVVGRARVRMYIRARVRVDISRARWRASICQ